MSGIAYSSGMKLIDSMVITYRIYCLKHPDTNEVFYIGKTTKELRERLTGHIGSISSGSNNNQAKNDAIKEILATGTKPIIEEVEVIYGTCYIHSVEAGAREYYWINYYSTIGNGITNYVGVKTNPTSMYWEKYVRELKEGRGEMANYLCGKTQYGIPVYDEEKMSDDGFRLEKKNTFEYMAELEKPKSIWTYEKIYDDENPNYIMASIEEL
jgi:hypothetical protein